MVGLLIIAALLIIVALWAGPRYPESARTRWGTWIAAVALLVALVTIPLSYPDLVGHYPGWFVALYWAIPVLAALITLSGRKASHARRFPLSLTGAVVAIGAALLFLLGGTYTVLPGLLLLTTALLDAPRPRPTERA